MRSFEGFVGNFVQNYVKILSASDGTKVLDEMLEKVRLEGWHMRLLLLRKQFVRNFFESSYISSKFAKLFFISARSHRSFVHKIYQGLHRS